VPKLSIAKQLAAKLGTKAEAEALLKTPHIAFTTANPMHGTSGTQLSVFDAAQKLKEAGEDVKVVRGVYGKKEPSIFVSNPKNSDEIQKMAKEHGQDSMYQSSGGKNYLLQLNDSEKIKAGQALVGEGSKISPIAPPENYTKLSTKEGPVYYQGNLDFEKAPERMLKHYGPEGISEANPLKAGTGADERKLLKSGPDSNKTTQFYNILDDKEPTVSGTKYITSIPEEKIYDTRKDPKNLITNELVQKQFEKGAGREADAIKGSLKEGGVDVFERPLTDKQSVLESFNSVPLKKGLVEGAEALAPKLAKSLAQKASVSAFEEGAKAIAGIPGVKEGASWALEKAKPVLENEYVQKGLELANKPQEYATKKIDELTGGTGDAKSFTDVASRLQKQLPEGIQENFTPGMAKDVGYAADFMFPNVPLGSVVSKVTKANKAASLGHGVQEIINGMAKNAANVGAKAVEELPKLGDKANELKTIVEGSANFKKNFERSSKIAEKLKNSPEAMTAIDKLAAAGEAPNAAIAAAYNKATGKILPVTPAAKPQNAEVAEIVKKKLVKRLPFQSGSGI
jgi:hypothetical protein